MFDMINIFEVFLPQLLRYPNPADPLNGEAAALLMREPKSYDIKVKGKKTTDPSPIFSTTFLTISQSTFRNTPVRMPRMKQELKAKMTKICPRSPASAMTTNLWARWMTYRKPRLLASYRIIASGS
jgi:hypothetical protein